MKTTPRKAALTLGTTTLAVTLLSACGSGPALMFQDAEMKDLDKTVESLDTAWAEHRANGIAANVSDDSRCYLQKAEDVLAEAAICGPVHYLGDDETTWDSIKLFRTAGEKDSWTASHDSTFSSDASPGANTEMYRPDGKTAPEETELEEPPAEEATAGKALWRNVPPQNEEPTLVRLADGGTVAAGHASASDRLGGATDRIMAPEGHKLVGFELSQNLFEQQPKLTLSAGGKDYPIDASESSGGLAMAVPGDGTDARLTVEHEGLSQSVDLVTGKLTTTADALYDGVGPEAELVGQQYISPSEESNLGGDLKTGDFTARHMAWTKELGWAPEGKVWIEVAFAPEIADFYWKEIDSFDQAYYDTVHQITSATLSNVDDEEFSIKSKSATVTENKDWGADYNALLVFEAPVGVSDFNLDLAIKTDGTIHEDDADAPRAPKTVTHNFVTETVELNFPAAEEAEPAL